MNYVFFGTPEFAAIILQGLITSGFPPVLVITNPDMPKGRKKEITPPPAKIIATKSKIPVFQPHKISQTELSEKIKGAQFAIVAAYSKILPKEILEFFPNGVIGVHPSLLPQYRGASPIQGTILNGETTTGVTLFMTDKKVDHGPIIAQQKFQISNFPAKPDPALPDKFQKINPTYLELHDMLAKIAGNLLIEILPKFVRHEITPKEQNHTEATFTKKFVGEDGYIDLNDIIKAETNGGEIALFIDRKIRALNPEPGTWTKKEGKRLKLLSSYLKNGKLVLAEIQWEGQKPKTNNLLIQ